MNRFVKKLLAKYIKYIEIIGYAFVLLFIAGLVALSFIKAEDEYVNLNGLFEVEHQWLTFEQPHFILDLRSESGQTVAAGDPLLEVTADEKFLADRTIQSNLEAQLETAENAGMSALAGRLSSIIMDIESRDYPELDIAVVRSQIDGYFDLVDSSDYIPAGKKIGGVFNFGESTIRVTAFPADKRLVKKVKPGQSGQATIALAPAVNALCVVSVVDVTKSEIVLKMETISEKDRLKLIEFLTARSDEQALAANVNLLVGWKSWMRLIWR
ncbi:MAG: hypothetical protein ACOY90_19345 [Candidatus Zhuqueibacterota bacterium]